MSLAHDMWNRLQQAAAEAAQEDQSSPRGIIPMSRDQGQQVLHSLQTQPYHQPQPRQSLRPMTMEQGALIQYHLSTPQPLSSTTTTPSTLPLTPVKTFLQKFLK